MGFWNIFLPTFFANLLVALIFATFWEPVGKSVRRLLISVRRSFSTRRKATVNAIWFRLLVFTGKKQKTEYQAWVTADLIRSQMSAVISQAPVARAYTKRETTEKLIAAGSAAFYQVFHEPPFQLLVKTANSLSIKEWGTSIECSPSKMTDRKRAEFLLSMTTEQTIRWALRLTSEDRAHWEAWVNSYDCQAEIESFIIRSRAQR